MKEYTLTLTENQIKLVNKAIEEYFRVRLGQFFDLSNELAGLVYNYDENDPENDRKFDEFIMRRNEARDILDKAYHTAIGIGYLPKKTSDMLIAEDLYMEIRHAIWTDDHPNGSPHHDTAAYPPVHLGDEPKVKVEIKERKLNIGDSIFEVITRESGKQTIAEHKVASIENGIVKARPSEEIPGHISFKESDIDRDGVLFSSREKAEKFVKK